eukprot:symbB.v1.2.001193.t1/scaffold50.1/size381796/8
MPCRSISFLQESLGSTGTEVPRGAGGKSLSEPMKLAMLSQSPWTRRAQAHPVPHSCGAVELDMESTERTEEDIEEEEATKTCEMDESEEQASESDALTDVEGVVVNRYQRIDDTSFDEVHFPEHVVEGIQSAWNTLLSKLPSREVAGIMEEAPGIAKLFKSPRSVFALRFVNGLNSLVTEVGTPSALKKQVETFGFQHLDYEVSVVRADLVRDCILSVMEQELGGQFTSAARICMTALLNYVGGPFPRGGGLALGHLHNIVSGTSPYVVWACAHMATMGVCATLYFLMAS